MPAFIFSTCSLSLEFGRAAFPEIEGLITSRLVFDLAAPCGKGIMDTKEPSRKREGSSRTFSLPVTSHSQLGIRVQPSHPIEAGCEFSFSGFGIFIHSWEAYPPTFRTR